MNLTEVTYAYPDGIRAIEKIDLRVRTGERVALVGPNGAGKSTLLKIMAALLFPTDGSVEIMGEELTKKNAERLRRHIGFLFQDPDDQIFMPTVWDDVAFGPINMQLDADEVGARVRDAMRMAGIEGYEQRVPHHLSFGEKKRVAIAGVLAMRSPILLLDEPTANLDPQGRMELMNLLAEIDGTIVLATHDLSVAFELADRAVVLKREKIFDGDFRKIVDDSETLRKANLELPSLCQLMIKWKERTGKEFPVPLTVKEALGVLESR